MSLFNNVTHQQVWIESHCGRCHHGGHCLILDKALRTDRKPVEWERNTRKGVLMSETMKCHSETRVPPLADQRRTVDVDVPMFELDAVNVMDSQHD